MFGTRRGNSLERLSNRVLVVDDSEPFRNFICSNLREKADVQIIGEVSDGLEAVRKAEELQPDLILLDIGLPFLNGIEAARRIFKVSAESKILFVSQEFSSDVVQEALGTGALGYVLKSDAGKELLEALHAVLRGEQFIGKSFSGYDFSKTHETASRDLSDDATCTPLQADREILHRHELRLYSGEARSVNSLASSLGLEPSTRTME